MGSTRIYTYFDDTNELPAINKQAEEIGLSLPSFVKYCTLLYVHRDESSRSSSLTMPALLAIMDNSIDTLDSGTTFIVSSLFDPNVWTNLSKSDKRTLGHELKKNVDTDDRYELTRQKRGQINRYKRV